MIGSHRLAMHVGADRVPAVDCQVSGDSDVDFSKKLMPEPPGANLGDLADCLNVRGNVMNLRDHIRLDAVESADEDFFRGAPNDEEDAR